MHSKHYILAMAAAGTVLATASPAQAMHIADNILSPAWTGIWWVLAVPAIALGLWGLKRRAQREPKFKALTALVGAAIFVISAVPIPVLGSSSHPCGIALGVLLIGPGASIVVTSIALLLQALLLGHGGLTTVAAGVMSMGVVGGLAAWSLFHGIKTVRLPVVAAAFIAGMLSDWAVYVFTGAQLAWGVRGGGEFWTYFWAAMVAFMPTQLPLGVLEGVLTAGAYRFVLARRPELLSPTLAAVAEEEA